MERPQPATIEDIVHYTPETYFTDDELSLLRSHFNGPQGLKLLKIIRKIMVPSISDPELPVEELGKDLFMSQLDFKQMPAEEAKAAGMGLQLAAKAVLGGIIQLKQLANVKDETPAEKAARLKSNSSR